MSQRKKRTISRMDRRTGVERETYMTPRKGTQSKAHTAHRENAQSRAHMVNREGGQSLSSAQRRVGTQSSINMHMENPAEDDYSLEALGRRIRIARIRRNLALWEVAMVTRFNRNTIAALEHGYAGTSIGVLWAVLRYFNQQKVMASLVDPDEDGYGKALEAWMREGRANPAKKPYKR